ncbi:uncharacterized protein MYCGRDRAFT_87900 [Zymoseptoria tritici IPO323]|uniref:Isochorismatase-like domain-containing protein n=1 Tax=Zymoseptoria tritici (strain CBS 115943 / IPO323) TaxID=336722 RepID=F9XKV7_ZYMTI|nr:uncharacterized protein MYCGRDRAFT_87900 [Zymoseptoria tritici IPO323]EGP83969.1 hypothetical protein MYCGRDRAFT_87900 [Zymoseptoria tritici IPO323]
MPQSFRQTTGARPSTATPSDSVLIIIGAWNEYTEGALNGTDAANPHKATASLLNRYREANGQIVHVDHQIPNRAPVSTPGPRPACVSTTARDAVRFRHDTIIVVKDCVGDRAIPKASRAEVSQVTKMAMHNLICFATIVQSSEINQHV